MYTFFHCLYTGRRAGRQTHNRTLGWLCRAKDERPGGRTSRENGRTHIRATVASVRPADGHCPTSNLFVISFIGVLYSFTRYVQMGHRVCRGIQFGTERIQPARAKSDADGNICAISTRILILYWEIISINALNSADNAHSIVGSQPSHLVEELRFSRAVSPNAVRRKSARELSELPIFLYRSHDVNNISYMPRRAVIAASPRKKPVTVLTHTHRCLHSSLTGWDHTPNGKAGPNLSRRCRGGNMCRHR